MGRVDFAGSQYIEEAVTAIRQCRETMFDASPLMMHSIDQDGRLVEVNRRWLDELGYHPAQVLGYPSVDFLTPDSRIRAVSEA